MKFKKKLLATLVAMAVSSPVLAQTASIDGTSGMGILQNEWVKDVNRLQQEMLVAQP